MGEVVIRLDGRTLERIVYWIIIIVLVVLLIFSYIGDDNPEESQQTSQNPTTTEKNDPGALVADPVVVVNETCFDDTRNQDEIGVDCGGVCTNINGAYWYDNKCHEDPEPEEPGLTGKIEFSVTNVKELKASSDALKVESFQFSITNGKPDDIFPVVVAYAKTTGGVYLNQFGDSLDDYTPYMGPFDVGKVASGDTVSITIDEAGSYIFEQTGYDLGEDFKLVVELLDEDGKRIDQISKTVSG